MSGIVQDESDGSYESKKQGKHVDARQVQVVEIGAGAFSQVLLVQYPGNKPLYKAGDRVTVTIKAFRQVFSNMLKVDASIELVK